MKPRCVAAVSAALGRDVTLAESRTIEQRISDALKREAVRDPETWAQLSLAEQLKQGAASAAKELVAEAQLKKRRVGLQIEAWDRAQNYAEQQIAAGIDKSGGLDSIDRMLAPKNDGKSNILSVESNARGIEATTFGKLVATWEAISPKFMGIFKNKDAERALILELHGTDSGNAIVKQAAQAWRDAAESLRVRFNAAGGDVGKLENWGMPHGWSQKLVTQIGKEQFIDDMIGFVDRSKYVHEDGRAYTDEDMRSFLGNAWTSIATDGANKLKPEPQPGGGIKANRNRQSRQIHFRDGESALAAFEKYSERNLFQVLSGHVRRMSNDIALVEQFGPNADHAVATLMRQAEQRAKLENPASLNKVDAKIEDIENLYNYLAGNQPGPVHEWLANAAGDLRAVLSAAKLGSAPISSIADEGTLYLTAHVNKIPLVKVFLNELSALNPLDRTEKRLAMRSGLMVKTMMEDIGRFSADTMGPRWSNQMSNFFMRLSGLEKITEVRRRAFSVTMMDTIGSLTRRLHDIGKLDADDYKFLADKGIDADTWAIWRAAQPEKWGGNHTVLTPESIMRAEGDFTAAQRERAATRLLSVILDEQNTAVIEPGARERAGLAGDSRAGTFKGELLRSIFLFKSFPHAMITKHVQRGLGAYDSFGGKAGYLASLVALQTIMGAVALEVNDVLSGRDPRNLNPAEKFGMRNWLAAVLKGGALGVYGDFIFDQGGASGQSPVETMAGPVFGTVAAGISLTQGNAVQYLRGQETHVGAEAARFLRGITPGLNLWYAKAGLDHLIFQNMQEYFSPGYLADTRAKALRNAGTTYWWNPGQPIDAARAPNVANIVGAK